MMATGFAMARFYFPSIDFGGTARDEAKRAELRSVVFGGNEFEHLLFAFIGDEIPIVFLERYGETNIAVHELYREEPVALMSATSWHYNDVFKMWAASRAEKGAMLVGLQHGAITALSGISSRRDRSCPSWTGSIPGAGPGTRRGRR